jgi:hypothetical protein
MEGPREAAVSVRITRSLQNSQIYSNFSSNLRQITTAVNFLNNPKVAQSTLIQKRNFLARKGLTEEEIQRAFEKVGIFFNVAEMNGNVNSPEETIIQVPQPYKYQMTPFEKIKDMVSSAALISGIVYGVYMFYKVRKPRKSREKFEFSTFALSKN